MTLYLDYGALIETGAVIYCIAAVLVFAVLFDSDDWAATTLLSLVWPFVGVVLLVGLLVGLGGILKRVSFILTGRRR
jgi:hypothetical protein